MNGPIPTAKNYPDQALDHFPHCNICARNAFLSTVVDARGRAPEFRRSVQNGICRAEERNQRCFNAGLVRRRILRPASHRRQGAAAAVGTVRIFCNCKRTAPQRSARTQIQMIAHSIDGFRSAVLLTLSSPSQAFRHFHSFVCQEQRLATTVRLSLTFEGSENEDNCKTIATCCPQRRTDPDDDVSRCGDARSGCEADTDQQSRRRPISPPREAWMV